MVSADWYSEAAPKKSAGTSARSDNNAGVIIETANTAGMFVNISAEATSFAKAVESNMGFTFDSFFRWEAKLMDSRTLCRFRHP